MLIVTPRHRPTDLDLWRELEAADSLVAISSRLSRLIEQAHAAITTFVASGPCYAGVSWGKDSVVLAHLLWSVARQIPLMHLRPTNHNPDCDLVRDAYLTHSAGQSYQEVSVDYSRIDRVRCTRQDLDRATDARWYAAIRDFGQPFGGRHILGIRAEESTGRRFRVCRWGLNSPNGCAPLGRWTTADVFGYLSLYNLPIHPAYGYLGDGRWPRERLRVAEIGDTHGTGGGRSEWEREYYGDVLRRNELASYRSQEYACKSSL
jgi:phosphoadenosine phosphosulfate reductase